MRAIRHESEDLAMPMGGDKLSGRAIADLVRWIEMDAPWPETAVVATSAGDLPTSAEKAFWSFSTIGRPVVPEVRDAAWSRTVIDRFVRDKLAHDGLEPALLHECW